MNQGHPEGPWREGVSYTSHGEVKQRWEDVDRVSGRGSREEQEGPQGDG